jgi:hypothetical protein
LGSDERRGGGGSGIYRWWVGPGVTGET